ncbi:MAG: hypothetical protein R3E84_11830 [Pseudomonadales bacterium]
MHRGILALALGGNALSPADAQGYAIERDRIAFTGNTLRRLAHTGWRLLIVHGNGPQVGRLLDADAQAENLDIHTAQTQGELGYLLARELAGSVSLVTRVHVHDSETRMPVHQAAQAGDRVPVQEGQTVMSRSALAPAVKAIGPLLAQPPAGVASIPYRTGWRQVVPSPLPHAVIELLAIRRLLTTHHVIAGGGGGIPLDCENTPVNGVVDKDRVAALLAIAVGATRLVFATDVDGLFTGFDTPHARLVPTLSLQAGEDMLAAGEASAGSMGPKLESALQFARQTGREALICRWDALEIALSGAAGTRITG